MANVNELIDSLESQALNQGFQDGRDFELSRNTLKEIVGGLSGQTDSLELARLKRSAEVVYDRACRIAAEYRLNHHQLDEHTELYETIKRAK